jgi:thymidylate synthase
MGQTASRRRQHHYKAGAGGGDMKKKKVKKYPLEIWRQIKDIEILQLQEKAKETEKEFERVKKKIACQSFLLKEIFEDTLKLQRENHDKEIDKLKKEIAELKGAMETAK